MIAKRFSYAVLSILALFLVLGFASAYTLSSPSDEFTLAKDTITLTAASSSSDPSQVITIQTPISFSDGANSFNLGVNPASFTLAPGAQQTITLTASSIPTAFKVGSYQATLTATSNNSTQGSKTSVLTFKKGICKNGPVGGNLTIDRVRIESTGDEDTTWKALDEITVEVRVSNDGDESIKDVNVELALYDSDGKNIVGDLDFTSSDEETVNLGRISSGDYEETTFEFKVPADFETGDYKLFVKAYSDDSGESNECTDTSSDLENNDLYTGISFESEDDEGRFIVFDNIVLTPSEAVCGDSVTLDFDAYNIGDDQDQVRISISNKDLGLDMSQDIRSGLDEAGDSKKISFAFNVPSGLAEKTYTIDIDAEYDYRSGTYRESLDEPEEITLKVFGCAPVSTTTHIASILASLSSEAKAGSNLVISATVTNLKPVPTTFVIDASGYESWAQLVSVSPATAALDPNGSKDVTITLKVNEGVTGDKTFNINAKTSDKTESREVSVNFPASAKSAGFSLGSNWLLWIIGIVNVLLIIIIVIVAIRVSRR